MPVTMATHASDGADEKQTAPWLPIPSRAISVVEHPCIIKNVDKGIVSLGGPLKLSKVSIALRPHTMCHRQLTAVTGTASQARARPGERVR